jgi:pyruvate,water dikinase
VLNTSVVDVMGNDTVGAATVEAIDSASGDAMAVLEQPLVGPVVSGVLCGIDPVAGDESRLLIAAVTGLPERLVFGNQPPASTTSRHEAGLSGL